ncbi:flavin-containing monooxygenase [Zhongshania sp. BJYM1]|uniref:flavin-containing monooxygenase n=1 Tax=Zhongshania aquatica TaxID=2965069 RepID=UPI0022B58737|nr:NAD(P)/FAD-dependent oxidoreductase [Marortus sp. BJYM1]
MTLKTPANTSEQITFHETIVVGAGISGICAAIKLKQAKIDFIVLEKSHEAGGVWRENVYPDCACDVPSALYSYSFAPNPDWTRVFATQQEIKAYTHNTVKRFKIDQHIHFNHQLSKCNWHESDKCWQLETNGGIYRARFVIMACGPMHIPLIPHIKGIETFPGKSFHSATWDTEYDLSEKRVAVIGSGGSAIQFLPAIQRKTKKITLFQRTPPWVLPKVDTKISDRWRKNFKRFPFTQKLFRKVLFFQFEFLNHNLKNKWFSQKLETAAIKHIHRGVKDEALREKLKPDYSLGCKRILLSNNWYKALGKDNVEVFPGIAEIQGNKLIASDGSSCEVDVIIYGTGFEVSDPPIGKLIYGRNGRSLSDQWSGSPSAYLGTMAEDCPNLFLTLGPNLYTYTSAFVIIEAQVKYILSAITKARKRNIATITVNKEKSEKLNKSLQNALQGTVWNSGCASYFIDKTGRNSVNWPWTTMKMQRRLSKIKLAEFQIEKQL